MSGSNGAATLAEEGYPITDSYALAAASAEADQKNEERRTDTFRRQNIFQYVIIVILSVTSFIGLFTHKVEVKVVYDHNGTLVDGGTAAALAAAWQRFMRVVHAGPPASIDTPACDHDVDLLGKCRRCGAEADRA